MVEDTNHHASKITMASNGRHNKIKTKSLKPLTIMNVKVTKDGLKKLIVEMVDLNNSISRTGFNIAMMVSEALGSITEVDTREMTVIISRNLTGPFIIINGVTTTGLMYQSIKDTSTAVKALLRITNNNLKATNVAHLEVDLLKELSIVALTYNEIITNITITTNKRMKDSISKNSAMTGLKLLINNQLVTLRIEL